MVGSTTVKVNAADTAASIALPPCANIFTAAWVASGCAVATTPFADRATLLPDSLYNPLLMQDCSVSANMINVDTLIEFLQLHQ